MFRQQIYRKSFGENTYVKVNIHLTIRVCSQALLRQKKLLRNEAAFYNNQKKSEKHEIIETQFGNYP
jgi:hypothetical protein